MTTGRKENRFTVLMANIAKVPPYNAMYNRSMSINYTRDNLNRLVEETDGLETVALQHITNSGMFEMSGKVTTEVVIENNWDAERSVVVMLIKDRIREEYYSLAGYTNKPTHVEGGKSIALDTIFTFSSITRFERNVSRDGKVTFSPNEADLMLGIDRVKGVRGSTTTGRGVKGRPKDILSTTRFKVDDNQERTTLSAEGLAGGQLGKGDNLDIHRSAVRMVHALASSGRLNESMSLGGSEDKNNRAIFTAGSVSHSVAENDFNENNLLSALFSSPDASKRDQTVGYDRLSSVLTGLRFNIVDKSGSKVGQMGSWDKRSAGIAAKIANNVPALMMSTGILGVSFFVTNVEQKSPYKNIFKWAGGDNSTVFMNIEGLNTEKATRRFEETIRGVIMPDIGNHHKVTMQVTCRLTTDMAFEIEVDGKRSKMVAPTFGLSKWGTIIASEHSVAENSTALLKLGKDIEAITATHVS